MDEENKTSTPTSEEIKNNEPEVKETPTVEEKAEPKVETTKVEQNTSTTNPPKKKKNGLLISIIIIIIAVICGAVGGAIYATCFSKTEIDLSKYVSVEFKGYEGYASFTEDDLVIDQKGLKNILDSKSLANKLEEKLLKKATVKENSSLKNGDEIEVKFKVSDSWLSENKIKLASDTIKIKVKDLEEPNSVDLFKDLEFSYSGISPDLTLSLKNNSKDEFIQYKVTFTMEKGKNDKSSYSLYDVANGDEIKVTATYNQEDLEKAGYIVKEKEYTFTVKDQAEYVKDVDSFTGKIKETVSAKLLEKAKNVADGSQYDVTSIYHEDFGDINHYDYNFTHTTPELSKMYVALNKDMSNVSWSDSNNIIYAIYKTVFTDSTTSKTYDLYIIVNVDDIVINGEELYTDKTYYYEELYDYGYDKNYHKSLDEASKIVKQDSEKSYNLNEVK